MAAPVVSFRDIWAAFMADPPVRNWLFNRNPLTDDETYACVMNNLSAPLSFSFDPASIQETGAESPKNLHDFAQLSTVLYHVGGVALGVTFGNGNKQPVLPMAAVLNNEPDFEDNVTIVRRCAIRRISPRSRHLVRLQADWFRSGVLGFDFSFIPADNPDLHPSVGFAIFGYRMFKKHEAAALYQAAMYPSEGFRDGSTPLLTPSGGYLTMDACDSQFQTPCIFCASRNTVLCHCPAPLRRRVENDTAPNAIIQALTTNTGESDSSPAAVKEMVWRYFSQRMKSSLNSGTFLTNWRYERPSVPGMSHQLVAHVVPYALLFNNTGAKTPIVQRAITALNLASQRPHSFCANILRISPGNRNGLPKDNTYHHGSCPDSDAHFPVERNSYLPSTSDAALPFYQNKAVVEDSDIIPYHKARQSSCDSIPTLDLVSNPHQPTVHHNNDNIQPDAIIYPYPTNSFDQSINSIYNNDASPSQHPELARISEPPSRTAQNNTNMHPIPIPRILNDGSSHSLPVSMMNDLMISGRMNPDCAKLSSSIVKEDDVPVPRADSGDSPTRECMEGENGQRYKREKGSPTEVDIVNGNSHGNGNTSSRRGPTTTGVTKKETRVWHCDQCPAVIRGKRSNLTRHKQNKHDKVRAFRCTNCPKRFQTRLNLDRHQKLVHDGRPHECTHCPRKFKTQDKLQKHLQSVHGPGAKPQLCPHCNGCYGKRSTLSRHIISVHKALSDVSDEIPQSNNNNNEANGIIIISSNSSAIAPLPLLPHHTGSNNGSTAYNNNNRDNNGSTAYNNNRGVLLPPRVSASLVASSGSIISVEKEEEGNKDCVEMEIIDNTRREGEEAEVGRVGNNNNMGPNGNMDNNTTHHPRYNVINLYQHPLPLTTTTATVPISSIPFDTTPPRNNNTRQQRSSAREMVM